MRSVTFIISLVITASSFADEVQPGQFWCDHKFKDQIVEINDNSKVDSCVADLVWGFENICFTGEASDLVEDINADKYKWTSSGLILDEARYDSNADLIVFTGYDQQSFFSKESDIARCSAEFFQTKED